jgi:hypothetical protein
MAKITDEELKSIEDIKKEVSQLIGLLGELEYQRLSMQLEVDDIKAKIKDVKNSEIKLLESLRTKYGNVNINIETGEIS